MRVLISSALQLACASLAFAQVVINEILFDPSPSGPPDRNHQWVELHNKGSEPVDLSGWKLSNRGGPDVPSARSLPPLTIPPSGYLVLHFTAGQDRTEFGPDGAHVYSPDASPLWNPDQDAAALYSPAGIADFLSWRRFSTPRQSGRADADAVAARIWNADTDLVRDFLWYSLTDRVREIPRGVSAGRDQDSNDTNQPPDFESNGGRHSFFPTPGRRNLEAIENYISVQDAPGAVSMQTGKHGPEPGRRAEPAKKWTVMWYFAGEDVLPDIVPFLRIQEEGGSNADVNYLVHWTIHSGRRTLRGQITPPVNPGLLYLDSSDGPVYLNDRHSASAAELAAFLAWAKANYPAERFALIVAGHGAGWKILGEQASARGRFAADGFYPGELSMALAGTQVELLILDSNYSALAELARQVSSSARFLVGFPNLTSFSLTRISRALSQDPSVDGEQLGKQLLAETKSPVAFMDLRRLPELMALIREWSAQMREAMPIFNRRDDPSDNVQVRIMDAARRSWRALDDNFTDLADFAERVQADSSVPACAKRAIPGILTWIRNNVTAQNRDFFRTGQTTTTRGLTIHLPAWRAHKIDFPPTSDPHDLPALAREEDGNSLRVSYASSRGSLPLSVEYEEGISERRLNPRTEWPRPPAPRFPFPADAEWQQFLDALYAPAADNHIVEATFGSLRILPVSRGGGACANPVDEITVPVGAVVKLSGAGSSDVDMANGLIEPYTHMWDLNDRQPCRQQPCRGPHEVDPGADALRAATDNLDADAYLDNTNFDDLDARGPAQEFRCTAPGEFVINLIVGDDDHLERHADTLPTAGHVRPQTGSWASKITCVAPGGRFVSTGGAYPFTETGTYVFGDHAYVAPPDTFTTSPRNFVPFHPFLVAPGPGVTDLHVNGIPLPDGTSTVLSDGEGILRTRFTAGPAGPGSLNIQPVGLPNVPLPFTIVNRLAPLPTNLDVTLPVGNVPVGSDASLTISVTRNNQPLGDAIVTAWSPTSTANFVNGTPFRNNTASQFRAGPTGRFLITFRPAANGPVHLNILAGQILRSITLIAAGGPRRDPTSIQFLPGVLPVVGRLGEVGIRVLAVEAPVSGAGVRVEVQSGNVSIPGRTGSGPVDLTTNADGVATFRFTPNDPTPLRLRATIPGTNLAANANLPVGR